MARPERSSVQDKTPTKFIDNSYLEFAVFSLFRIDILNFIKAKASFAKEFHIPPSELDNMPVWEYELFLKEINDMVKEENERNHKEMDNSGYKDAKKMSDPKYASRMSSKYMGNMKMPSMPNLSSMSMPKI